METKTETKEYTVDAKDKRLGHIATEVATILLGKNTPAVTKHTAADVHVTVINASHVDISERKRQQKEARWYTGYPGGLKREKLGHRAERRGYETIIREAVSGMLPKNKLQKVRLKNLHITE